MNSFKFISKTSTYPFKALDIEATIAFDLSSPILFTFKNSADSAC